MTTKEKLALIDAYLAEGCTDKAWREMIMEYRAWLVSKAPVANAENLLLMV